MFLMQNGGKMDLQQKQQVLFLLLMLLGLLRLLLLVQITIIISMGLNILQQGTLLQSVMTQEYTLYIMMVQL